MVNLLELCKNLQQKIEKLEAKIERLERENESLKAENKGLKIENAELKERLGLNSRNSSLPSSRCMVPESDGILSSSFKESLWDKYYMGAPKQHRRFVEQYKIEKRA